MSRRVAVLCALFALSGFCGLIYESIWTHYLKHFVGHAAYAQSLVLMAFMGGMGLGAWLISRFTSRIANLLWAYAAVEAVVGLTALGFHTAYGSVVEWAYASLLPASCAAEGFCAAQWLLATAMILPQSILLGTTFPLMAGGVIRLAPDRPGHTLALFYFLNSIGAVLGVLASGFVLIPLVGLPGALMTAGIGNVVLAVVVYQIGKPAAAEAPAVPAAADGSGGPPAAGAVAPRPLVALLLAVSLLTGLSSFIYEIAWIRMLSMVMGSATHSFEIMLASFILGLALGGWWIRTRIDASRDTLVFLAVVQVAMGVCALLTLPLYNHTFDAMAWLMSGLARSDPGYVLFTLAQTAIALAVMLPTTFCAGMTLPLITAHLFGRGSGERAIGQVYAANTIGAIGGVLLAVHLLMPQWGLKNTLVVGAAIDIALGMVLLWQRRRTEGRVAPAWLGFGLAGTAFALASPWAFEFDPMRMGSSVFRHGQATPDASTELLFARDGKTATVHVVRTAKGIVSLSTNGKSDGAIQMKPGQPTGNDETTMALLGALPLVYHPRAREVAQIGFGTGMSSATLLTSPHLTRVDTIEIEPVMVEAAQHFRPVNDRAFSDPRHRIVIEDAKAFFARGARRYDVIVSEPSNPWVSGVSSLFTAEFYARMRHYLADDGILVQWMHVYEITPDLVASVFRALSQTFPAYEVYAGSTGDMIIVASPTPRMREPSADWLGMPELKAMLDRVGLGNPNRLAIQRVTGHATFGPFIASYGRALNSDYFPLVDLNGPRTRFTQANALDMTGLHGAEMPVLRAIDGRTRVGFEGEAPAESDLLGRQLPYVRARQLVAYLRDGHRGPAGHSYLGDLPRAALARERLFTCIGSGPELVPWDDIVRLATETLPYLSAAEAAGFWRAAQSSPCARQMSDHQRRWLDLFVAVADDRWSAAGMQATALLADAESTGTLQRTVLTQVAALSRLREGDGAGAAKLLDAERRHIANPRSLAGWLRLMEWHAQAARR